MGAIHRMIVPAACSALTVRGFPRWRFLALRFSAVAVSGVAVFCGRGSAARILAG